MWVYYAWIAAVTRAVKDMFWKDAMDALPGTGALAAAFLFWLCALAFLAPFTSGVHVYLQRKGGWGDVRLRTVLCWVNISAACNVAAYWMFIEALRLGDLSIALPLRETVPMFALVIGVMSGDARVSWRSPISILLVLGGIYFLHAEARIQSMGISVVIPSALALTSAFIFAFAALCDQRATSQRYGGMHPVLYAAMLVSITEIWYTFGILIFGKRTEVLALFSQTPWWQLVLIGALGAAGTIFTAAALRAGPLVEVVVGLRAKVLLGVLFGGVVLQEGGLVMRLIGGGLLMAGVVLAAIRPRQ